MRLGDVHPDIGRYLREDCYCPGEIYDVSGFFCIVYSADDECDVIEHSDDATAVVMLRASGRESERQQAVMLWHDADRVLDALRVDATDNNRGILRSLVRGEEPDGRIDEYVPGNLARSVERVMSFTDIVMTG